MNKQTEDQTKINKTNVQTDDLQKQIEELKQNAEEWKGKYLRALADYQNQERRMADIGKLTQSRAEEVVVGKLLPIIDLFDQIVMMAIYNEDKGLKAVWKQLHDLIEGFGVTKLSVIGKVFDPRTMECVDVAVGKEGIVLEEYAPGYTVRESILRAAKVKVGKENVT